jgi:hypothetical protein
MCDKIIKFTWRKEVFGENIKIIHIREIYNVCQCSHSIWGSNHPNNDPYSRSCYSRKKCRTYLFCFVVNQTITIAITVDEKEGYVVLTRSVFIGNRYENNSSRRQYRLLHIIEVSIFWRSLFVTSFRWIFIELTMIHSHFYLRFTQLLLVLSMVENTGTNVGWHHSNFIKICMIVCKLLWRDKTQTHSIRDIYIIRHDKWF